MFGERSCSSYNRRASSETGPRPTPATSPRYRAQSRIDATRLADCRTCDDASLRRLGSGVVGFAGTRGSAASAAGACSTSSLRPKACRHTA